MKYKIIVTLAAREDTLEALNYYENIKPGLGEDFLEDLEERYIAICQNPYAFSYTDSKCVLRDVILNRFPYLIIFKIQSDHIIALSVHNIHKKPLSF
ncbi:MAG: hypothetical protein ACHQD8_00415 [Chitinophagales bacterium]